jgi:hypothetical protein
MKNAIILRESYKENDKKYEAYTALTLALRENKIPHLYDKVRGEFDKNQPFIYGKFILRKVNLNQNHRKK